MASGSGWAPRQRSCAAAQLHSGPLTLFGAAVSPNCTVGVSGIVPSSKARIASLLAPSSLFLVLSFSFGVLSCFNNSCREDR